MTKLEHKQWRSLLKRARQRTQQEVSNELSTDSPMISQSRLAEIENGTVFPSMNEFKKLNKYYGIKVKFEL